MTINNEPRLLITAHIDNPREPNNREFVRQYAAVSPHDARIHRLLERSGGLDAVVPLHPLLVRPPLTATPPPYTSPEELVGRQRVRVDVRAHERRGLPHGADAAAGRHLLAVVAARQGRHHAGRG